MSLVASLSLIHDQLENSATEANGPMKEEASEGHVSGRVACNRQARTNMRMAKSRQYFKSVAMAIAFSRVLRPQNHIRKGLRYWEKYSPEVRLGGARAPCANHSVGLFDSGLSRYRVLQHGFSSMVFVGMRESGSAALHPAGYRFTIHVIWENLKSPLAIGRKGLRKPTHDNSVHLSNFAVMLDAALSLNRATKAQANNPVLHKSPIIYGLEHGVSCQLTHLSGERFHQAAELLNESISGPWLKSLVSSYKRVWIWTRRPTTKVVPDITLQRKSAPHRGSANGHIALHIRRERTCCTCTLSHPRETGTRAKAGTLTRAGMEIQELIFGPTIFLARRSFLEWIDPRGKTSKDVQVRRWQFAHLHRKERARRGETSMVQKTGATLDAALQKYGSELAKDKCPRREAMISVQGTQETACAFCEVMDLHTEKRTERVVRSWTETGSVRSTAGRTDTARGGGISRHTAELWTGTRACGKRRADVDPVTGWSALRRTTTSLQGEMGQKGRQMKAGR
ncbi:hypothetical protein C8R44DRAFT_753098 [Mycena epipterygia]|nr:hypothetical protein C8R44DRAFT_753098 [Mycena epipterygia]